MAGIGPLDRPLRPRFRQPQDWRTATANRLPFAGWPRDAGAMPFPPLSDLADPPKTQTWAYCTRELECGHQAKLDVRAILARFGDMPQEQCKRRLRCSKCGGRARMVTSYE